MFQYVIHCIHCLLAGHNSQGAQKTSCGSKTPSKAFIEVQAAFFFFESLIFEILIELPQHCPNIDFKRISLPPSSQSH